MKKIELLWGASLATTGICTLAVCINAISEYKLPDWAVRAFGVALLLCVPALVFFTVMLVLKNRNKE